MLGAADLRFELSAERLVQSAGARVVLDTLTRKFDTKRCMRSFRFTGTAHTIPNAALELNWESCQETILSAYPSRLQLSGCPWNEDSVWQYGFRDEGFSGA